MIRFSDDRNEFLEYCSVVVAYMELQFSKYKDLKHRSKDQPDVHDLDETKRKMSRFILNLYEVEYHLSRWEKPSDLFLRSKGSDQIQ